MIAEKHVNRIIKSHRSPGRRRKDPTAKKRIPKGISNAKPLLRDGSLNFPDAGHPLIDFAQVPLKVLQEFRDSISRHSPLS